jgi:6-pyruvoyltetrahydropterin/6-carboxytetrahydropterin synthase
MTVFPDGSKERLHGHNYTLGLALELAEGGELLPFAALKAALASECGELRERLLLPGRSPRFTLVSRAGGELEFRLCDQRYVVPEADAQILPIDNATVEALAGYLLGRLYARLEPSLRAARVELIEVAVEETPGQGARASRSLAR